VPLVAVSVGAELRPDGTVLDDATGSRYDKVPLLLPPTRLYVPPPGAVPAGIELQAVNKTADIDRPIRLAAHFMTISDNVVLVGAMDVPATASFQPDR